MWQAPRGKCSSELSAERINITGVRLSSTFWNHISLCEKTVLYIFFLLQKMSKEQVCIWACAKTQVHKTRLAHGHQCDFFSLRVVGASQTKPNRSVGARTITLRHTESESLLRWRRSGGRCLLSVAVLLWLIVRMSDSRYEYESCHVRFFFLNGKFDFCDIF